MANRIKGITIVIDGDVTPLQKALGEVDNSLKKTNTALRDVNKLLKLNPTNITLIKQKQDLLKKAIQDTKTKLEQEKKALAQLKEADESPEVKAQMEALERQIIDDTNKLEKFQKELKGLDAPQVEQIKSKLTEVGGKLQEVGGKVKDVGEKMKNLGSSLTQKLTVPIMTAAAAAGKIASDYEESMNKIDTAFGKSGKKVKEFTSTTTKQFGISKTASAEMVSGFGAIAKGIGLGDKKAATMSTTLTGLSGDLASYFNTTPEEAAKALEGIFTGESEALKKFGVVMNDTNLEKFAEDHGKVWKEMSQEEKTMMRYQFVLEKTKDAQGDYARTSTGTANSVKTAKAALSDLALVFGQMILPVITPIIQKVSEFIQKLTSLPAPVQRIIGIVALVLAALGPVLVIVGSVVSVIGTIISGVGSLITVIGGLSLPIIGIVAAIAAAIAIGVLLYKNWDTIKAKAQELMAAIKAKFAQIKANIIAVWNNVKESAIKTWNNIKSGVIQRASALLAGIKQKLSDIKSNAQAAWQSVKEKATTAWEGIKTAIVGKAKGIVTKVKEQFGKVKDAIKDKLNDAKDAVKKIIDKIKGFFKFDWELPKPKIPKFKFEVKRKKIAGLSIPYPKITPYYAKAYHQPYLFSQPTMMGGAVFGDRNGDEMVYGRENLMRDISKAAGVDADRIYNAVREGASNANITMYVGERELGRVLRDMGVKFA